MKRDNENAGYVRLLAELAADRKLTVAYVKNAMESVSCPDEKGSALIALRLVAEAYGGLGAVARATGVSRATVYRSLSADGNPRLDTLLALLRIVGLRLSVESAVPSVQLEALKIGAPKRNRDSSSD
ncbi:helix-turn-helix domain-containing transcriptional regulator [Caballeronia sp. M23-90]